jgi:ribonuclease D
MTADTPTSSATAADDGHLRTPGQVASLDAGGEPPDVPPDVPPQEEAPVAPLLGLRDGLPPLTDTPPALAEACAALATATGPVAIDAERASGYRYSSRAYLIQLRREGAGTFLVDPIGFDSLQPLQEALAGTEWILHAATQDLGCLTEVGLVPSALFDTELAGRLLGYPRVGLATLVETLLGYRMKKEHSAADWSTRPFPTSWLEYAALDVEVLIELRDVLAAELVAAGKEEWARQEFEALRSFAPLVRAEPWRRTSGLHRVRGRRLLGAVRELWLTRDELAQQRDVSPGRLIGDSALVAAAMAMPEDRAALLATKGFHGRGAQRYADRWVEALRTARELPEDQLPARSPRAEGPPTPRAWAERDPAAAARLVAAREVIIGLADEHGLPAENLLSPDSVRRLMWSPPDPADAEAVAARLREYGAREWQIGLTAGPLADAIASAPEAGLEAGAEAGPDVEPEAGPDLDLGPELA